MPGQAGSEQIMRGHIMELEFHPEDNEETLEGFQLKSDIRVSEYAFVYNKTMVWDWRSGGKTGVSALH